MQEERGRELLREPAPAERRIVVGREKGEGRGDRMLKCRRERIVLVIDTPAIVPTGRARTRTWVVRIVRERGWSSA